MNIMASLSVTQATDCCTCGIVFGVPGDWIAQKRADHQTFYCPNGHSLHYPGETPQQRRFRVVYRAEVVMKEPIPLAVWRQGGALQWVSPDVSWCADADEAAKEAVSAVATDVLADRCGGKRYPIATKSI